MKVNSKILASFAIATVLVGAALAVSVWAFRQIESAAAARQQTANITAEAEDLLTVMIDAETSQRGFSITGDELFLEPYVTAHGIVDRHLNELRRSTGNDAAQRHLAALPPLINLKFTEMAEVIALRRSGDLAGVVARISGGRGKQLMDSIRSEVRAFLHIKEAALEKTETAFADKMRQLLEIIGVASLAALALALAFAYLLNREAAHRVKDQVLRETQQLLDVQKATNEQLRVANIAVQFSEAKLAVTLHSIGDAVIATDQTGRVTFLNPVAEQLTGWLQADANQRPIEDIFQIINQETRKPVVIPVTETLAHGVVQGLANHTVLVARDGREFAIADSCAPIRNDAGLVTGAVLVFRDVTKEYAANQAGRDGAALIQAILNTITDGIITLHASGGIIERANSAAEQMFGYEAVGLIGQNFSLLIPELDRDQRGGSLEYYNASDAARAAGLGREVLGRRRDGTSFPLEISVSETRVGGTRYFTGILRNITARKHAEQLLLKAGALQSAIFNSANFSSIATDAKGVIQIFNVGAARMLGYTAAEVVNQITPADISDPQEVVARAKALSAELETPILPGFEALVFKASRGIEDIYELTYIRKNGSRFPAIVSVTALRDAQSAIIGYLLIGTDNTARKEAEEALLKAGALQRAIFQSANFSSIATDAAGVIQIFNVGAERMLGYAASDVMNKITPADISDPQEVVARAKALSAEFGTPILPGFEALVFKASRGIEDIYELTYKRKDGSRFPAIVSVTALRDAQTTIIGYLLIGTDNTARKEAEEALLKAGALQRAIFQSANFSSIATDAAGVIQIFNVGAERMLGYAATDVMNKITPADISDPQEVIMRAKALSAELGTPILPGFEALVFKASRGIEDIYELTYIRKDGSRFPAIVSVTALRDAQSTIIGYLLIGTDNTARKRIEAEQEQLAQRLRDQQFYTRSLFESNIDALMTTDPSGIITDVNKQMEALTGSTRDELIGSPFKNSFTNPDRAETSIKLVLSEKKITNYELTARARDGKETMVSYNATTFYDRERRLQGVFAAARDVTERQRAEENLRRALAELNKANAELAQTSRLKDEFLANMSHELHTPLNAILGLSESLLEQVSASLTPRQVKSVTTISTSGQHLLMLINDILDLSKIEAGKLELALETVNVEEFCQSCLVFVRTQAMQKKIAVSFVHDESVAAFTADAKRLKQVLVNLLTNAVKFTPEGGRIGVIVATPPGEDVVRFTVWDTGIGIAPHDAAKLFRAFTQIDSGLSRAQEGTGLGLALVAKLVELHGGSVTLESEPSKGSRFIVTVPLVAAAAGRLKSKQIDPAKQRRNYRRALIIEDDPTSGAILGNFLTDLGIASVIHLRGEDAIEVAQHERPDVILLDILLPGESGWVVLAKLKEHAKTRNIPVVVISFIDEPRKSLALGAVAHFTKPITRAQLNGFFNPASADSRPSAPPFVTPTEGKGALVLLAEDNEANIETIGDYLEDRGYNLHYAMNGQIAVKLTRHLHPAIILMDIQMPVMDGLTAIREIRADPEFDGTPIIALTALAMPGDRERCVAAGATDYMSKPVSLKTLAALVQRLLSRPQAMRPPANSAPAIP